MQEIYDFAKNRFGTPRYKEAERRLRALARKMYGEGLISESLKEREGFSDEEPVYHHRFFDHYPERASIVVGGEIHLLTPTENRIMYLFTASPNRFIPHLEMLNHIWGDQHRSTNILRVYVGRLRKTLTVNGQRLDVIESARGQGYRLIDPLTKIQSSWTVA